MEELQTVNAFDKIIAVNIKLHLINSLTIREATFSTLNIARLKILYDLLFSEISTSFPMVDLDYYRKLFRVVDYELVELNIYHDDVFYPLYKYAENLLVDANSLDELIVNGSSLQPHRIDSDSFVKSILNNRKMFLGNLNMTLCDRCSLKMNGSQKRLTPKQESKDKIDEIMLSQIKEQQELTYITLTKKQLQFEEYVSLSTTAEILKLSYDEVCGNKNYEHLLLDEDNIIETDYHLSGELQKEDILKETSIPDFVNGLSPEALVLEADWGNSINNSPVISSDVTNQSTSLYLYCPLFIIVLWLLIILKRSF